MSITEQLKYVDRSAICVVTKNPWTAADHLFVTLQPLMLDDGQRLAEHDFPSNGQVWWLIAPDQKDLAEPGQLVSVVLEESRESGNPGKDHYQVARNSACQINESAFVELLEIPKTLLHQPTDLLKKQLRVDHPPSRLVYAVWDAHIYGPLLTRSSKCPDTSERLVTFELPGNEMSDQRVNCLSTHGSQAYQKARVLRFSAYYSNNEFSVGRPNAEAGLGNYILAPLPELKAEMHQADSVSMETDAKLVNRVVKHFQLLNRPKRKQLKELLEETGQQFAAAEFSAEADSEPVRRLLAALEEEQSQAERLVATILEANLLKPHLASVIKNEIESQAEQIATKVATEVESVQAELDSLRLEKIALSESLRQQAEEAEQELKAKKVKVVEWMKKLFAQFNEQAEDAAKKLKEREQLFGNLLLPFGDDEQQSFQHLLSQFVPSDVPQPNGVKIADALPIATVATEPSQQESSIRSGSSIHESTKFVRDRLWPILLDWVPTVTLKQAEFFHLSLLGCRCSLVPNSAWSKAYADAAQSFFTLFHVEPDWLSFSKVWTTYLKARWLAAKEHPDSLHVIMFSGVDRSPSTAWALPLLSIAGRLNDRLPSEEAPDWPPNLRVLFSFEPGPSTFEPGAEFVQASGAVSIQPVGPTDVIVQQPIDGFVSVNDWIQWCDPGSDEIRFGNSDPQPPSEIDSSPWRRSSILEVRQLAKILIAEGKSEEQALRIAHKIRVQIPPTYLEQVNERK